MNNRGDYWWAGAIALLCILALAGILFLVETDCPVCDGGKAPILSGVGMADKPPRPCPQCGDGRVSLFGWYVLRQRLRSSE